VKVLTALFGPTDAVERARALREAGAAGVFTFEGPHDVFAPLTLASTVGGLDLMTNVAIAFPRNPIQLAHQAYDHQLLSGGRFTLGLGTQIRTQVEKRYGASFDQPVVRMRELISALRAIFDVWQNGGRLDYGYERSWKCSPLDIIPSATFTMSASSAISSCDAPTRTCLIRDFERSFPSNSSGLRLRIASAEKARAELGDSLTQRKGSGAREPGRKDAPMTNDK
jgi:hypothetical protein